MLLIEFEHLRDIVLDNDEPARTHIHTVRTGRTCCDSTMQSHITRPYLPVLMVGSRVKLLLFSGSLQSPTPGVLSRTRVVDRRAGT